MVCAPLEGTTELILWPACPGSSIKGKAAAGETYVNVAVDPAYTWLCSTQHRTPCLVDAQIPVCGRCQGVLCSPAARSRYEVVKGTAATVAARGGVVQGKKERPGRGSTYRARIGPRGMVCETLWKESSIPPKSQQGSTL